jgi:hypothetical protein
MDILALLCTLHADGPASIQRLRAAELDSIDDVLGCSVETTAEVLGLSMAQARRFHREARMLAMRTQGEGLDREESMYPGGVAAELAAAQAVMKSLPGNSTPDEPARSTEAARSDEMVKPDIAAILAPVLERWDQEDASAQEETSIKTEGGGAGEEAASASTTSTLVGSLDGVDTELSKTLVAAGYGTLEAIKGVEPLALSRAINRPYSEACRVLFLARRALDSISAAPGGGTPSSSVSISVGAASSRSTPAARNEVVEDTSAAANAGSEGLGGPFA